MHKNGKGNIGVSQAATSTTASVAVSASETGGGNVENNHRRFSNLSNLAQSLPSNSSSASALAPVTGSYDYLTSYKGRGRPSKDRRKKTASNANCDPSVGPSVRRTQSAFETHQQQIRRCKTRGRTVGCGGAVGDGGQGAADGGRTASRNNEDVRDSEEDEPLLMKRHQSLDENRQRCSLDHRNHPITLSSRSLDRYLDDKKKQMAVKNEGKVLETMDFVDPEAAFQAEILEEATQALLHLSQCKHCIVHLTFDFEA